jgi:hypothetical protein
MALRVLCVFVALASLALAETTFHGRVVKPEGAPITFLRETKVIMDGGAFQVRPHVTLGVFWFSLLSTDAQAFLQEDGEFSFDNIPSGAYHLEVGGLACDLVVAVVVCLAAFFRSREMNQTRRET